MVGSNLRPNADAKPSASQVVGFNLFDASYDEPVLMGATSEKDMQQSGIL